MGSSDERSASFAGEKMVDEDEVGQATMAAPYCALGTYAAAKRRGEKRRQYVDGVNFRQP